MCLWRVILLKRRKENQVKDFWEVSERVDRGGPDLLTRGRPESIEN